MGLEERLRTFGYEGQPEVTSAVLDAVWALKAHDLTPDQLKLAMELLSADGYKELTTAPTYSEDDWMDFDYGNVKPGAYVRVKPHSYDSDLGAKHNGRIGVLLNIAGRRCMLRYLGTRGRTSMRHPIGNLQSLRYGVQ